MSRKKTGRDRILFEVWDDRAESWLYERFKARIIEHEGRVYKLFRISVLAAALGKHTNTLRRWERSGQLPKATYSFEGLEDRYYSEDQIRMTAFMQRHILGNDPRTHRGAMLNMDGFFEAVRENWGILDFDPNDFVVEEKETGKNDVEFDV